MKSRYLGNRYVSHQLPFQCLPLICNMAVTQLIAEQHFDFIMTFHMAYKNNTYLN